MKEPEDAVWDAITDSAKRRFDYQRYKAMFKDVGDDNIPDNILFKIILGYVQGDSKEEIEETIKQDLALVGFLLTEKVLQHFLKNMETELNEEIRATRTAIALFKQGLKTPGVLVQVKSILK